MMTSDKKEEEGIRRCAYCLVAIPLPAVKLCGGCQRRAYCSRDCQIADWSPKRDGQGHKTWCSLLCGEEDLDWKVSAVPGKGLGLIAKRMIPAKFRIIVDVGRPKTHPAIKDLMPLNGTLEQKFQLNCLGCDDQTEEPAVLCLRIARANHHCDPNADHLYDETFKVKILFAERDIQEGEEICINYQPFNDISNDRTASFTRRVLKNKWGIVCPSDCFCYDKKIEKVVQESRKLDSTILNLARRGKSPAALASVKKLLENHEIIHSSWISKERTLYDGFQIAIMEKNTLNQAPEFIRQLYETASSLRSPCSLKVLNYAKWMKDNTTHRNYLTG